MINKTVLCILEPFHGMFRRTFWKFLKVDALFILGLYIINAIGAYLAKFTENILVALLSVVFISFFVLVTYTACKSIQYKHMEKNLRHHEILGKHLFVVIILGIFGFIVISLILKLVELFFQVEYVLGIQKALTLVILFYFYLIFLNTHNHDHHSSFKAILKSVKSLHWKRILKILYFDGIYFISIYLLHNIITFGFQYLFISLEIPSRILNPIYDFLQASLFIILIIAILSMNKIIIYRIEDESIIIKRTKKLKKTKTKKKYLKKSKKNK